MSVKYINPPNPQSERMISPGFFHCSRRAARALFVAARQCSSGTRGHCLTNRWQDYGVDADICDANSSIVLQVVILVYQRTMIISFTCPLYHCMWMVTCPISNYSLVDMVGHLAMFGNNHFFAFSNSI